MMVLNNEKIAVTGALTGPLTGLTRAAAAALIIRSGGIPVTTVSKQTAYLVASRDDTRKARQARRLGIPALTPTQFAIMLGYPSLW